MPARKISVSVICVALILLCSIDSCPHASPSDFILENELLTVTFDPSTGALVNLVSKHNGWEIQRRRELGRTFSMLVPLHDRRNNPVLGEKQAPPIAKMDTGKNRISFTWNHLKSEYGGVLDISFTGIITLTDNGLDFEAKVVNNSPYVVETVSWPYLGDLSIPEEADKLERIAMRYYFPMKMQLFPKFESSHGYYGTDYPIQMIIPTITRTQFIMIDSGIEGLYAGYHDITNEHLLQFTFELKPGYEYAENMQMGTVPIGDEISGEPVRIEFSTIHFPFFASGESGNLHTVVLYPYSETWINGIECYKKWRKTWYTPPPVPEWTFDVHSWQQIQINSSEGEFRFPYGELVKYGKACVKHGVKVIQLTGWTLGGQDHRNPSHDIDSRLGTWEDLRNAIAEVQDMGVKIILFNKYTWADRSQEWFRNELIRYACKDPYGDYYLLPGARYHTPTQLSDINTRRFIPMCFNCKEWLELCCSEFRKGIELGATGMLYIDVDVEFDDCTSTLLTATPEHPEAFTSNGTASIPPVSVVVFMEQ